MYIKTKTRDPKQSDFSKNELVININEGSLFYKSNKGVHKLIPGATTVTVGGATNEINNFTTEQITNEYITNNSTTINNMSFFTATGNDIYYTLGKVGIGTATPTFTLDVGGDINLTGDIYKNGVLEGSTNAWTVSVDDIYRDVGNVGIGTATPSEKLEINGNLFLNVGDIRSSGDLNLLTDDTIPHAEDKCYINIKSTTAASDINGDLNLISNHTIAGDINTVGTEAAAYGGFAGNTTTGPPPNFFTTNLYDSYQLGYFAANGVGNFTCEGDAAIGKFLAVGWNISGGSAASVYIPSGIDRGSIIAIGDVYSGGNALTSDIKLKKNIAPIEDSLNKILSLEGKTYEWKDETKTGKQYGLIAQDVEKIIPELVNQGETKYLNYTGIIPVLIEAIKDQQQQINELKSMINNG